MSFQPVTLRQTNAEKYGVWFETMNGYPFVVSPEDARWVAMYQAQWSGSEGGDIRAYTFSLHRKIMERSEIPPPTPEARYIDHKNGKRWDNRRENLRWATSKQNGRNKKGITYPGVSTLNAGGKKGRKKTVYQFGVTETFERIEDAVALAKKVSLFLYGDWSPYYDHESG